jgi:hypothetical protein
MPKFVIDYAIQEEWSVEIEADTMEEAESLFWSGEHDEDQNFIQSDILPGIAISQIPS